MSLAAQQAQAAFARELARNQERALVDGEVGELVNGFFELDGGSEAEGHAFHADAFMLQGADEGGRSRRRQ